MKMLGQLVVSSGYYITVRTSHCKSAGTSEMITKVSFAQFSGCVFSNRNAPGSSSVEMRWDSRRYSSNLKLRKEPLDSDNSLVPVNFAKLGDSNSFQEFESLDQFMHENSSQPTWRQSAKQSKWFEHTRANYRI